MFGQFRLAPSASGILNPFVTALVVENRAANAACRAWFTFKSNGTASTTKIVAGEVATTNWLIGSAQGADWWIYAIVTVDAGGGLSVGTAATWQRLNSNRTYGVDAPAGPDDQQCHVEIFIQLSAASPGTTPTQGSPAGSTYMGTLNLHAESEP